MTTAPGCAPAEPFFLRRGAGQRFCLYHRAAGQCRGAVLYVPPFAEELNRTRRMAALQSRALAAQGFAVLQLDLDGCGDSSGDFGDARWDGWKEDVGAASAWLEARCGLVPALWGLRLGALLALDYAAGAQQRPAGLVLWQPVHSGHAFMTQFLRLKVAGAMLSGADAAPAGTAGLRAALAAGATLEVAGYDLHPALVQAIDAVDAGKLRPHAAPVDWFDIAPEPGRPAAPASVRIIEAWRGHGAKVRLHQVAGPAFWASQEIAECPALIPATTSSVQGVFDAL